MTTTKTRAFIRIVYLPLRSSLLVVICITLQLLINHSFLKRLDTLFESGHN